MDDKTKQTGVEPVFDTDKAWARFEKLAAQGPAPAFWQQAEKNGQPNVSSDETIDWNEDPYKEGEAGMKPMKTVHVHTAQDTAHIARPHMQNPAKKDRQNRTWHTESPAKRRLRRWTAGAAAACLAVGLFATPLGDRAMAALQQTFRIQHVVGIGVSADDLSTISSLLERGSPEGDRSFSLAQYGTISQSGGGKNVTVTWEEAQTKMGAVSLIQPIGATAPVFEPASTLTFTLNVGAVNRMLTRLGSSTLLPEEADGKAIRLHIPDGISTEGTLTGKPVRLLQYGKPDLTVEDGIDPAAVREAVLGLPVLPESLRTKLAAIGDWQNTLPVPAPDGVTTNLRIGSHDAVLTVKGKDRILFWLNGNRMGLLSGSVKDFPAESAFLQAAKELILP